MVAVGAAVLDALHAVTVVEYAAGLVAAVVGNVTDVVELEDLSAVLGGDDSDVATADAVDLPEKILVAPFEIGYVIGLENAKGFAAAVSAVSFVLLAVSPVAVVVVAARGAVVDALVAVADADADSVDAVAGVIVVPVGFVVAVVAAVLNVFVVVAVVLDDVVFVLQLEPAALVLFHYFPHME